MKLIAVVMAAPDFKVRFQEVMKLLDYGYANYAVTKGSKEGQTVGSCDVIKGKEEIVDGVVNDEKTFVIPKDSVNSLEEEIFMNETLVAPIKKGTKIGEITYKINGSEVGKSDIVAAKDIEKAGIANIMKKIIEKW